LLGTGWFSDHPDVPRSLQQSSGEAMDAAIENPGFTEPGSVTPSSRLGVETRDRPCRMDR